MNKLELLAREATDLARRDSSQGSVHVSAYQHGEWSVEVHVHNECAFQHCEPGSVQEGHEGTRFGAMREYGPALDTVLDRMLDRVADAVAGTPCEQVPA